MSAASAAETLDRGLAELAFPVSEEQRTALRVVTDVLHVERRALVQHVALGPAAAVQPDPVPVIDHELFALVTVGVQDEQVGKGRARRVSGQSAVPVEHHRAVVLGVVARWTHGCEARGDIASRDGAREFDTAPGGEPRHLEALG